MMIKTKTSLEQKISMLLIFLYVFASYCAIDLMVSRTWKSITLFAFIGWGALSVMYLISNVKLTAYSSWYIVFMTSSFIIMFYSPAFNLLAGEFYLMIVSFCITFLLQFFIRDEEDFQRVCWYYAISSLVLVIMLHFTGNLQGTSNERLGEELFGNANNFAGMVMVAVMYAIWLLVYGAKYNILRLLLLLIIIWDMYALALSAGRKYFVIPFVFLYFLLLYKTDKNGRKHVVKYTIIVALLIILAFNLIMNVPVLYDSIGIRMEGLIDGATGQGSYDTSSAIRERMRNDALSQWQEKPIFGHGFDSYKYRAEQVMRHFFYSHCNFTELLYNGGVVYFAIYYWIYYLIIKRAYKSINAAQKFKAFSVATAVCLLVFDYGAVSYSISFVQIMLAMALKGLSFSNAKEN